MCSHGRIAPEWKRRPKVYFFPVAHWERWGQRHIQNPAKYLRWRVLNTSLDRATAGRPLEKSLGSESLRERTAKCDRKTQKCWWRWAKPIAWQCLDSLCCYIAKFRSAREHLTMQFWWVTTTQSSCVNWVIGCRTWAEVYVSMVTWT